MADFTAEEWLAVNHPDQPALPADDTGRSHREVALSEAVYWETPLRRPGVHRNPAWRQQEAIASQGGELVHLDELRRARTEADPCSHCGAEPATRPRTVRRARVYRDLGESCFNRLRRTGTLPAAA